MQATNVWFGNEQWPSGASPGEFARSVFRIENCQTDKQRALVFFTWFQRCFCRGPQPRVPAFGGYGSTADPLLMFAWGFHSCTGYGWVPVEALQSAGLKARRVVNNNSSHTIYEVWYAGENAKEAWHAFDAEQGFYCLNREGEVASCAEIAANPDLLIHWRGGSSRYGNHPERSLLTYPYNMADSLDILQPVENQQLSYTLQPGQSYENLWRPELPYLAWGNPTFPQGPHCDISLFDEAGKIRYPEHHPYWRNYVWPTQRSDGVSGGQPVRWHACGALRWRPLLYGDKVVARSANALFENGTVRPTGANKHCEVWWHFKLPYMATYLRLAPVVEAAASDPIGFAISPDAGKSLYSIHFKHGIPPKLITNGPRELPLNTAPDGQEPEGPTIRGCREFWLRLDMSCKSAASPLRVLNLGVTVGYQMNMQTLPRLLPGNNTLYLAAGYLHGAKLEAEWVYTDVAGRSQTVEKLELEKSGRTQRVVDVKASAPDDLIMRGVNLRCL